MYIVFLNGSKFSGNSRDLIHALWHPLFVALVLGMTGVILLVRPYDHFMPEGVMIRALIICSSILVYMLTSLFLMSQSRRCPIFTKSFAVLLASVFVTSFWGVSVSVLTGGQALGVAEWTQLLAFNTLFCTVGEIFLATFLLERIVHESKLKLRPIMTYVSQEDGSVALPEVLRPAPEPEPEQPRWVELLGQNLEVAEVWHLKAEEHYVAINLRDGRSLLLRGRLADAIAQLPEGIGMQVHRSHWIACAALADVRCTREGCNLLLHSGAEVPVARNRKAEVRPWAEALLQKA